MGLYFAYGSNLWLDQMKQRCPDHRVVGKGILKGYRWIISSRGYANILESPAEEVEGTVYQISSSDETNLDKHEGVATGAYEKKLTLVEINGQKSECLVYIDPTTDEGRPDEEYIRRLTKGLRDAKLSRKYIERYTNPFIHKESLG